MLSPALMNLAKKPTYHYEPKLGWEQVRPASGEVRDHLAEQFVKAQGAENLVTSLASPAVRALLKAEVSVEQSVVLAYHADEARQRMDQALDDNLGPNWKQSEHSLSAPEPGNNHGFFVASCGGRTYKQELCIDTKNHEISLRTRGKSEGKDASHSVKAHYDPRTGEIIPETLTSDYNWNLHKL